MEKEIIKAAALPVKVDANTGLIVEEKMSTSEIVEKVKAYVDSKEKKVFFNGKRYPEIDDWEYIGTFYGLKLKTFDPAFVEIDGRKGFKARAALYDEKQNEVGRAESYCLNDEPNWMRKPLFQLASMAQTRAGAKAFSNLFRPIARMCSMETTPFEEMDSVEAIPSKHEKSKEEIDALGQRLIKPKEDEFGPLPDEFETGEEVMSDDTAAKPGPVELENIKGEIPFPQPAPQSNVKPISEKQAKLIWVLCKKANLPEVNLKAYIREHWGVSSTRMLPWQAMEPLLKWIDSFSALGRK